MPADIELAQDPPMVLNDARVIGLTLDAKSFPATQPIVVTRVRPRSFGARARTSHVTMVRCAR